MKSNRRQITLKQLLIVTGLLSVIFTLAGPGKLPLSATLLLVASLGIAIGLWQQGRDIDRAMTVGDAPTDPRILQVWRFERNWRFLLASLVLFGWVFAALMAQGIFGATYRELSEYELSEYRNSPSTYADGLVLLVIVVGLASSVVRLRVTPRTPFATWVHRAGWAAGIALLVIITLRETAIIDALVHIAIRSIEMAQPEPYGETFYAGGVWVYESSVLRFGWLQLVLAAAVFINVAMLIRMTDRRAKRWSRVGYAFSIVVALGVAVWNRLFGFASIATVQAEAPSFSIAYVWHPAIALIVLFGFAATYRLLAHPVEPFGTGPNWRPAGKIYISETWWIIAIAALGSVWHSLTNAYEYFSLAGSATSAFVGALNTLANPPHYLHLAVVAACLQLSIVRLRGRRLTGQAQVELNVSRFAYMWIAVTMTTYVTLEAAFGASFVYWIVPWELLPLF